MPILYFKKLYLVNYDNKYYDFPFYKWEKKKLMTLFKTAIW